MDSSNSSLGWNRLNSGVTLEYSVTEYHFIQCHICIWTNHRGIFVFEFKQAVFEFKQAVMSGQGWHKELFQSSFFIAVHLETIVLLD